MARITGIGGIFFKAQDPEALKRWYVERLGVPTDQDGYVTFSWREHEDPAREGATLWSPFPRETRYFEGTDAPFMVNFRVSDLSAILAQLRKDGVRVEENIEESEYGRFGWFYDPEGNKVELWEPPARHFAPD